MKLSAKDIRERLKKCYVKDLRNVLGIMVVAIRSNPDFMTAKSAIDENTSGDLVEVVNDDLKKENLRVDFDIRALLPEKTKELFEKIIEIDSAVQLAGPNKRIDKMKKDEIVSIMSEVLADPILFEGLCISMPSKLTDLEIMAKAFHCEENFAELASDPVYQKRREFFVRICDYSYAAVNLYGAIHIHDLYDIVWSFEKSWHKRDQYERENGSYAHTLVFCPGYMTPMTIHDICGNAILGIYMTLDGIIVNSCFQSEYMSAQKKMLNDAVAYTKKYNTPLSSSQKLTDKFFNDYFDQADESYRALLSEALEKPRFIPDQKEFLRYSDSDYIEESPADKKLMDYLANEHIREIRKYADKTDMEPDDVIRQIWKTIKNYASDHDASWYDKDPSDEVQNIMNELENYQIEFTDTEEINSFLSILMPAVNETRLWENNGHTPTELAFLMKPSGRIRPKVVPMSSHAADILAQGQDFLKDMGVTVDFNATADEIPTLNYPQGLNETVIQKKKKIYPNDPCPCGSGKKYKRCCGRVRPR